MNPPPKITVRRLASYCFSNMQAKVIMTAFEKKEARMRAFSVGDYRFSHLADSFDKRGKPLRLEEAVSIIQSILYTTRAKCLQSWRDQPTSWRATFEASEAYTSLIKQLLQEAQKPPALVSGNRD